MIGEFQMFWTEESVARNEISKRYEPLQPLFLRRLAMELEPEFFIDVGANIGLYTCLIGTLPGIKVISCEPASTAFEHLTDNVRANKLENIHLVKAAIYENQGQADFGQASPLSGINSIRDTTIHKKELFSSVSVVSTVTLDSLVHPSVFIAKIDVEGHELEVLKGGRHLLSEGQGIIQIENYGSRGESIDKELVSSGWSLLFEMGPDKFYAKLSRGIDLIETLKMSVGDLIDSNKGKFPHPPVIGYLSMYIRTKTR